MGDVGNITDDEEFLELFNLVFPQRKSPVFRHRPNHFEVWNDKEFLQRFRLMKHTVQFITDLIHRDIESQTDRNHAVSAVDKVLLTLRFYATGSFMQTVGDLSSVDKSTANKVIHKVSRAIARLGDRYIQMPVSSEFRTVTNKFYEISRFPLCIGALDCTHIKIQSSGGAEPEIFRNRKGFFSYNVQCVCDADLVIRNIVCRWSGSVHDYTIFGNSRVRRRLELGEFGGNVLVGDSGYPIKNYLITPLRTPQTRAENLFNESQIRTRNPIERVFGIWKRRFPRLALGLRVKQENIEAIVVSTAVLHNLARTLNDPVPEVDVRELAAIELIQDMQVLPVRNYGHLNNRTRTALINNYFDRL